MVQLPGGFQLYADENSLVMCKTREVTDKKTGETSIQRYGHKYFASLPTALESWYRCMTRELLATPEVVELKEVAASVKALSDEVKRIVGSMTYSGGRLTASAPSAQLITPRTNKPKGTEESGL